MDDFNQGGEVDWLDDLEDDIDGAGQGSTALAAAKAPHVLDSDEARAEHRRLLEWYYYEKEKQAPNRLEMAIDHDFYDNIQWNAEDKAEVEGRGQAALVYNEVAPMVDWLIGTERRSRVDWNVLPRTEDDVELAAVKKDVLKYVSDINRVPFQRSRAFSDSIKGGIGWLDDGARDDPTKDILYSKTEDWRNVIHDSDAYELDLSDGRYIFRWRWVDVDIAVMMFPDRRDQILRAVQEHSRHGFITFQDDELTIEGTDPLQGLARTGSIQSGFGGTTVGAKRNKVRLIEAQYRKPVKVKVISDGPHKGAVFDERDMALVDSVKLRGGSIIDRVMMRLHVAVFTETDMLAMGPSFYRHNNFSLTPVWCYRRNRDRMPYGTIRRVRDVQQDLNKRASKALHMLNTNQIIADEGAVADWDVASEEVSRPDGRIIKKPGKHFEIHRDSEGATGQVQMMTLQAQSIQKSAGVAQENMGRQTNAVSGEAIKARQLQGSVVTTEPFDNLRLATQLQGEKQLSLTEQFYTEAKVIRLTGHKGKLRWVKVNQPEPQADGSVRWINDITSSAADFQVSEQDYAGTLRQVMFDSLNNIAGRVTPDVAMRLLTMAYEFSDLPNKDEIADQFRKLTGERDPDKEMSPEEEQAAMEQQRQQAEAMEMQRQTAMAALDEQRAKIREINAKASKLEADAGGAADGTAMQVRGQMDQEIERLTEQLRTLQIDLRNQTLKINKDADTAIEVARIEAASRERIAEIQRESDARLGAVSQRLPAA
ncbi:hypothetical protein LJR074_001959 [Acidovorax sp. LjRoot74]|uniref:portal protein n=1 Tax=Acidovorax sp. LjRoot74 TaxID=3342337 RepID=UPI003ECE8601